MCVGRDGASRWGCRQALALQKGRERSGEKRRPGSWGGGGGRGHPQTGWQRARCPPPFPSLTAGGCPCPCWEHATYVHTHVLYTPRVAKSAAFTSPRRQGRAGGVPAGGSALSGCPRRLWRCPEALGRSPVMSPRRSQRCAPSPSSAGQRCWRSCGPARCSARSH